MVKRRCYAIILLLLAPVVLSSCGGVPARDPGTLSRSYDAPLARVYEAARRGFQRLDLDIFVDSTGVDSPGRQYLQGGRLSEFTGRGETVTVWLEEVGAGSTTVWIDTQKPHWVWRQAFVDWSPKMLDHIQQDIQTRKRG
jgi:hypothetical protein